MLSNAYLLAEFRFDTAENEPAKNLQNFGKMHFSKMHFSKNAFSAASVPTLVAWARGPRADARAIRETNGVRFEHPLSKFHFVEFSNHFDFEQFQTSHHFIISRHMIQTSSFRLLNRFVRSSMAQSMAVQA